MSTQGDEGTYRIEYQDDTYLQETLSNKGDGVLLILSGISRKWGYPFIVLKTPFNMGRGAGDLAIKGLCFKD